MVRPNGSVIGPESDAAGLSTDPFIHQALSSRCRREIKPPPLQSMHDSVGAQSAPCGVQPDQRPGRGGDSLAWKGDPREPEHLRNLRRLGTRQPSAADLKSLHCKRRNEPRDFKSKSGTRIINLLVPMAFRSSQKVIAEMVYELRKVVTSAPLTLS